MAISQTTFDQRLARINRGEANDATAKAVRKNRRPMRARCLTFPFVVGVSILTGGAAYAWAATQPELHWVLALAG